MKPSEAARNYQWEFEKVQFMFGSDMYDDEDLSHALEDLGKARDAWEVAMLDYQFEMETNERQ